MLIKLLVLILSLSIIGAAVLTLQTPPNIPPIPLPHENDQTLALVRPYRSWTKVNPEPFLVSPNAEGGG